MSVCVSPRSHKMFLCVFAVSPALLYTALPSSLCTCFHVSFYLFIFLSLPLCSSYPLPPAAISLSECLFLFQLLLFVLLLEPLLSLSVCPLFPLLYLRCVRAVFIISLLHSLALVLSPRAELLTRTWLPDSVCSR